MEKSFKQFLNEATKSPKMIRLRFDDYTEMFYCKKALEEIGFMSNKSTKAGSKVYEDNEPQLTILVDEKYSKEVLPYLKKQTRFKYQQDYTNPPEYKIFKTGGQYD